MSDFFRAIEAHIEDKCFLDAAEQAQIPSIASLGMDNIIYRREIEGGAEERFNLSEEMTFDAFAMSPDGTHCLYGGQNRIVSQYNFADQSSIKLLETLGRVTSLRYSPGGKYIAVGSEEGKTTIYEPFSGRKDKCRPGHKSEVLAIAWHKSLSFLASIGRDQTLLIYKITSNEQPQEVARYQITKLQNFNIGCSFHLTSGILFTGGSLQLQKIENIENKWEYSKSSNIAHKTELLLAEVTKPNTIVTSSAEEVVVWSIQQEEKLFVVQGFRIHAAVAIAGKLFASCHDGKVYEYKREFRQEEPMELQNSEESDRIEFEEQAEDEAELQQKEEQRREYDYQRAKKTIAAKLITCEPQPALTQETQFFNDSRFLQASLLGCVTETQEGESRFIEAQFQASTHTRVSRFQFAKTKSYSMFALNQLGLIYANEQQFGFRPMPESELRGWERTWEEICAVTIGTNWVAVASDREIKILDMSSHELRSVAFDRQIVAMRAYENLLAVLYHQGVPLYGCQQLAIQLYLVDSQRSSVGLISNFHLPLSKQSRLKWIDYSAEGMLFTQDSAGAIRCLSLETNAWTTVGVRGVDDNRKIWMLGVKSYQVYFWKTSDSDPQPTVSPRFNVKNSSFFIPILGAFPEGKQDTYEELLWKRYILDHQKARSRLWGSVRVSRSPSNLFHPLTASILTQEKIRAKHFELDKEYIPLIKAYLTAKDFLRALLLAQNCIRCNKALEDIESLLDKENQRKYSIQLQSLREERMKEVQYEQMQIFEFIKVREEAERVVKPRSEDPMRRNLNRQTAESIPSLSQSFMSQDVERSMEKPSLSKQVNQPSQSEEADNPFLKRKSNHQTLEARRKEISEQVERFGIKQKVDRKNISKPIL